MDKKVLAGIGIIAVGGIAVFMMSGSDDDASMLGASGGGAAPETKKESQGSQAPVYNITFPNPNFPSIPNPWDDYYQYQDTGTKKSAPTFGNLGGGRSVSPVFGPFGDPLGIPPASVPPVRVMDPPPGAYETDSGGYGWGVDPGSSKKQSNSGNVGDPLGILGGS